MALAIRLTVMAFLYSQQLDPALDHWSFGFEEGRVARSLAQGQGFANPLYAPTGPTAWFAPVFPLLLACVFKVLGVYTKAAALAILSLDSIFSALTCLPVFFIARRSFGEVTAQWSGWGWAVFPYAVYMPVTRIWDTWLTTLLLSVAILVLLRLSTSSRLSHWIGFGLLSGFAALTSPAVLFPLPFVALWACWRLHRERKRWLAPAAVSVLAVLAVLGPWIARNYRVFHAFIPVRDDLGLEFRVGNNGDSSSPYTNVGGPWNSQKEWRQYQQLGEYEYMQAKMGEGLAYIGAHRVWYAGMVLRRIIKWWTGFWSFRRAYVAQHPFDPLLVLLNGAFSFLAFYGLWRAFRLRLEAAVPFAIVLLFFPLVYYATHTLDWYRRPIDPFLVILAAYFISSCLRSPR